MLTCSVHAVVSRSLLLLDRSLLLLNVGRVQELSERAVVSDLHKDTLGTH